jgi:sarcosine oxidase subunit gamma
MDKLIARSTVSEQFVRGQSFPFSTSRLQFSELPLHGILRLQGDAKDEAYETAISAALGLTLPGPERFSVSDGTQLAWVGPNEFLYFFPLSLEDQAVAALNASLVDQFATVTLMSDSMVAFTLSGDDAPAFLAKGCAIDLHLTAFPTECVVTTRFAGLPSLLMHRAVGEYVFYFDIGSAAYALNWMQDAAEEFRDRVSVIGS